VRAAPTFPRFVVYDMAAITSISNPRVKYVQSLLQRRARRQESCFLAEGMRLVDDALRAGASLRMAFYTDDMGNSPQGAVLVHRLREAVLDCFDVTPAVMKALSDTVTPQGVLAVVETPHWPRPEKPKRIGLILDQWRDPGNLGTVLRSAEAAGADWVVLSPGTVDPFSPKVVRGGMGAHFRLPIFADWTWENLKPILSELPLYLADAHAKMSYEQVIWTHPAVLIVGGEAHGPSDAARQLGAVEISIPMQGDAESLNAAVAASAILLEASRQRRRGKE
jgi:TrmH family RNA methyltransferase